MNMTTINSDLIILQTKSGTRYRIQKSKIIDASITKGVLNIDFNTENERYNLAIPLLDVLYIS